MRRDGHVTTGHLLPLVPFEAPADPAPILRAGVGRTATGVSLRWVLGGPVERVRLPERTASPRRADELWQHTCFEAFLAPAGGDAYWEINLSPCGHWNVYRFDGYRRGMQRETRLAGPATALERARCGTTTLRAAIDLSPVPELALAALDASLAAVLEETDGRLSYWSVVHAATRPDFHRRESFVVRVSPPG